MVTTRGQESHSRAAAGLAEFILAERASLVAFAFGLTSSREQAEDIVQDVFLRLLKANLEQVVDIRSYARRAVVNETRSWHRRLVRHRNRADRLEVEASRSGDAERPQLSQTEVFELLESLTPRQRTIVVAKYYFDLPDAEVAALAGCSAATVRSAASQALRNVRAALVSDEKTDGRR